MNRGVKYRKVAKKFQKKMQVVVKWQQKSSREGDFL